MRTMCRRHADYTRVRFHQRMTYVIRVSSGHLPELPNFMQYYTWCHLHVVCRHTCHPHVIHTSSAHHLHVICTHMSSACHLHTSLSCPISGSTTPGVICTSSTDTHVIHIICRYVHHLHSPHGPQLYFLCQRY